MHTMRSYKLNHHIALCYLFYRYEDVSTVMVRNSHLDLMDQDILYHLALGSGSHDLRAMFGDVKVKFFNLHINIIYFSRVCRVK